MTGVLPRSTGQPVPRLEGPDKVTGRARYAFEYVVPGALYGWVVTSPLPSARVRGVDVRAATAHDGVVDVLWHGHALPLADSGDGELQVLQGDVVRYAGQPVALVVAETLEQAREAAGVLAVDLEPVDDVRTELRADDPELYAPETVNAGFETDTSDGDVDKALHAAPVVVDVVYTTPPLHNQPMEPHAAIAWWDAADHVTLWDTTQNPSEVAQTTSTMFGLPDGAVVVHSPHVGGGFGSKGTSRPHAVLAVMAAKLVGRPVKVGLTRQQTFSLVGYRTPTHQHVRLGADTDGRLRAVSHEIVEQTSRVHEFAEQTGEPTRHMYAADARRVTHRLAALNVPTPRWMRAPGEAPGMFALESAMDELARALGLDPVELRIRNEPDRDPLTGHPFSSRHYVECLREGARRFGWGQPHERRIGRSLVGHGMAGSVYPKLLSPSDARATAYPSGRYEVAIAAADIGTGARTVLTQIAADALGVGLDRVHVELGDSSLPHAAGAGGSSGTASWGYAVTKACRELRGRLGRTDGIPRDGTSVQVSTDDDVGAQADLARYAFGAQFVEVRVDVDTGEVRVSRAVGVFAAGHILNPRTARSQFLGAMVMGIGMGLMEEGVWDAAAGDTVNDDLSAYHIPSHADIEQLDISWIDEDDDQLNPMGSKGIGEIGIVGTAAALCNAVYDATGIRVRDLPVLPDTLIASGLDLGPSSRAEPLT